MTRTRVVLSVATVAVVYLVFSAAVASGTVTTSPLRGTIYPNDFSPPSFTVPTLSGNLEYTKGNAAAMPLIFFALNTETAFGWRCWESDKSVDTILDHSPNNTRYLFGYYGDANATLPTSFGVRGDQVYLPTYFQDRFAARMAALNYTKDEEKAWWDRLFFATVSVEEMASDDGTLFVPELLANWTATDTVVMTGDGTKIPRLDAEWPWLPSFDSSLNYTMAILGDGCSANVTGVNATGKIALAFRTPACDNFERVYSAQKAGAAGLIIITSEDQILKPFYCSGDECNVPISIPGTMIEFDAGNALVLTVQNKPETTVSFPSLTVGGFDLAIDGTGLLQEVGFFLNPTFHYLAYAAQWYYYEQELSAHLMSEKDVMVINVFNGTVAVPATKKIIKLPPAEELMEYDLFELEMFLGCAGPTDASCTAWDRLSWLYISCGNNTVWELGRWITSFHRRVGHWVTHSTPLLPMLFTNATGECLVEYKVSLNDPWVPYLNFRFSKTIGRNSVINDNGTLVPFAVDLVYGGEFKFIQDYNDNFAPTAFTPPDGTVKVLVVATITGHGSDSNQCGEFCVTSHHFVVNGHANNVTFSNAATAKGCADRVGLGVTPNEEGTWLYGRDGWCDGQEVRPEVWDVTSQVALAGSNTLHYYGWFNGTDPNPASGSDAYMYVYAELVYLKERE